MNKAIFLFTLGILSHAAKAQISHPVKWSYGAKRTGKDEASIFLKASIEPGWHIYSADQPDGGPLKTSFDFEASTDYSLQGGITAPQPLSHFEDAFQMHVRYFENEVIFQQKIHLKNTRATVKGHLKYMVCNDHQCLPPEDVNFNLSIK